MQHAEINIVIILVMIFITKIIIIIIIMIILGKTVSGGSLVFESVGEIHKDFKSLENFVRVI